MYVYILRSLYYKNQFYVGISKDYKARLAMHNSGDSLHTKKFKPWEVIASIWFKDENRSYEFEKYLKTHAGREFLKKHFK